LRIRIKYRLLLMSSAKFMDLVDSLDEEIKLGNILQKKENEAVRLKQDLVNSESKVAALGRQLGESLKDQKIRIDREKELRMENYRLKMNVVDGEISDV
jgi:hypothetical protein